MVHISAECLRAIVGRVFEGAGAPQSVAERVAWSLVESNLVGHDSHGALRVGWYVHSVRNGTADPRAQSCVVHESATTALLDGHRSFGQVALRQAMDRAMDKARTHDVGMVAVHNTFHTGRMGEYVVQAAEAGFMGMVFGSGAAKGGTVAPYLGTSCALNTNPIAWGVPAGKYPSVFLDFATSVCAQGKIQAAMDKGLPIPEGWLLDTEGNPTTDPGEQRKGGALLPFGGHKGYGLGFLIEVLAGGLTGAGCAATASYIPDFATILMAVNINAFQPLDQFRHMVDDLVEAIKAGRRAPDVEEILVPGEPEWRTRERRLREGLDLPDATWRRIVDTGKDVGVQIAVGEATSRYDGWSLT
jgi:LDH2 family malate/lactate/ureidoglycolate dehydrogenase